MKFDQKFLITSVSPFYLEKNKEWYINNYSKLYSQYVKKNWLKNDLFFFSVGEYFKQTKFLKLLNDFGYVKVDVCKYPGEYSHKGMSVDIYPVSYDQIFRIEFEGNIISFVSLIKGEEKKAGKKEVKLRLDDYVVHLDHGIGIFKGEKDGYYILEYAAPKDSLNPDLLFVPLNKKNKIEKYYGFSVPRLHRLSTQIWFETKKKVKEDVILFAKELIKLYAKKETIQVSSLYGDEVLEKELDVSFGFDLTGDQEEAVKNILKDLENTKPMDRLVLGDVGFGKTEVAVRASFRVVLNKKQVVVLCPTTILANQHKNVFKERLEGLGVNVRMVSRLNSSVENKQILEDTKEGKVDVLIGTHRLLSNDVKFFDLGLLIIDEEQRFGVKQKEKIRSLKEGVHLLSLSATPIPRTLNFAMSGFKDISVIKEAPIKKSPIRTYVLPFKKELVKEAVLREVERKGQVFYLFNRVSGINIRVKQLKKQFPGLKISFLHGRMSEKDIISVMDDFKKNKIDILVTTTIIENGIDLHNVNTLIIEDSTRLGLSQLYQLRGRIGRGNREGYAYCFYPKVLKDKAKLRLEAIMKANYLGAGYEIAMEDLKIRGAGNLLGKEQSGTINKVGFNLYCQMLNEAISEIKKT